MHNERPSRFQQIIAETQKKQQDELQRQSQINNKDQEIHDRLQRRVESDPRYKALCAVEQDPNLREAIDELVAFFTAHDPDQQEVILKREVVNAENLKHILLYEHGIDEYKKIPQKTLNLALDELFVGKMASRSGYGITYTISRTGEFSFHSPYAAQVAFFFDRHPRRFSFYGDPQPEPIEKSDVQYTFQYSNKTEYHRSYRDNLTQRELFQQIADVLVSPPEPWGKESLAQEEWERYYYDNKEAIAFYNTLGKAHGLVFPKNAAVVYKGQNREQYETVIFMINHELQKMNLLKQIARNSASLDKKASVSNTHLSHIEAHSSQTVRTGESTNKLAESSGNSLAEIQRLILNLHSRTHG